MSYSGPPIEIDQKVIEAFHLMYDHFPEPATLVHKSRQVMAANPACKLIGREPGMICAKQGSSEAHQGCLAGEVIKSQKARFRRIAIRTPEKIDITAFWLPIDGYPDFYIHFAVSAMPQSGQCAAGTKAIDLPSRPSQD